MGCLKKKTEEEQLREFAAGWVKAYDEVLIEAEQWDEESWAYQELIDDFWEEVNKDRKSKIREVLMRGVKEELRRQHEAWVIKIQEEKANKQQRYNSIIDTLEEIAMINSLREFECDSVSTYEDEWKAVDSLVKELKALHAELL